MVEDEFEQDDDNICKDCNHHKRFHTMTENTSAESLFYGGCCVIGCQCRVFEK